MNALPSMRVEAVADPLGRQAGPGPTWCEGDAPPGVVIVAVHPAGAVGEPPVVADGIGELLAGWAVDLPRRLRRTHASGAAAEAIWIDLERDEPAAVMALGLGSGGSSDVRRAAAAAVRRVRGTDEVLVVATRDLDESAVQAFTEGLFLGTAPPTWASAPPTPPPGRVRLVVRDEAAGQRAIDAGRLHAGATLAARVLIHTPSNLKAPTWLSGQAEQVAAAAGLTVHVRDEHELRAEGFGGVVAVGAGSARPPRVVEMTWDPPGAARHVVLVGKGITFDSGGLSLKRPEMQVPMKTDMSGAATVCAVMGAVAQRAPEGLRVTGLLCLAENLPGARAMRPGDVVTHHGGLTSEVVNTDAEGRLVLGDGLDYAVSDLRADVVVDVATLTGAATLGLGRWHAALFSNSDVLAAALAEAGEAAGEGMWRLPLHSAYADLIASEVADQANSSTSAGPGPGAITAALFLERFVGSTPWAHLDIAGVGRSDVERDELPRGGTGFGARALLRWLEAGAPA